MSSRCTSATHMATESLAASCQQARRGRPVLRSAFDVLDIAQLATPAPASDSRDRQLLPRIALPDMDVSAKARPRCPAGRPNPCRRNSMRNAAAAVSRRRTVCADGRWRHHQRHAGSRSSAAVRRSFSASIEATQLDVHRLHAALAKAGSQNDARQCQTRCLGHRQPPARPRRQRRSRYRSARHPYRSSAKAGARHALAVVLNKNQRVDRCRPGRLRSPQRAPWQGSRSHWRRPLPRYLRCSHEAPYP